MSAEQQGAAAPGAGAGAGASPAGRAGGARGHGEQRALPTLATAELTAALEAALARAGVTRLGPASALEEQREHIEQLRGSVAALEAERAALQRRLAEAARRADCIPDLERRARDAARRAEEHLAVLRDTQTAREQAEARADALEAAARRPPPETRSRPSMTDAPALDAAAAELLAAAQRREAEQAQRAAAAESRLLRREAQWRKRESALQRRCERRKASCAELRRSVAEMVARLDQQLALEEEARCAERRAAADRVLQLEQALRAAGLPVPPAPQEPCVATPAQQRPVHESPPSCPETAAPADCAAIHGASPDDSGAARASASSLGLGALSALWSSADDGQAPGPAAGSSHGEEDIVARIEAHLRNLGGPCPRVLG
eukprot:TRINITY_DN7682_c2_g1_i2.p2 TRINITY_DN7682_c2_g1~~TRINITY_DN7682_c2_g1_i2.p2  ORF type:complete len:399 (+),score=143.48 TRINITY_DN7682_c2_g1_i2:67-1197(+)